MPNIQNSINDLQKRIQTLEDTVVEPLHNLDKHIQNQLKSTFQFMSQAETQFAMITALCIDTTDPWKQNRVRFFTPLMHEADTPIRSLPYAYPISSMGGFDDSGLSWVPPAGSMLCLLFENGSRSSPYYLGTTWYRNRGEDGKHNWGYNIDEYYQIHEGHRKGYLLGENDGSQVLPPWNTENYNGIDLTSTVDFVETPEAQKKATFPNVYGQKTPGKHMLKYVDGDYKCNHKNKRIELLSGCGNWLIFKDDHLHEMTPPGTTEEECEKNTDCGTTSNPSTVPFFKHKNELRPFKGPETPQNNKCALKQSGIQLLSISGHSFGMDDSVDQPFGPPEWERSTQPFDFGCNNKFNGKTFWVSATGHRIEMNDEETDTNIRSQNNYIRILSASGNKIELNDHSSGTCTGGDSRGILIQSTSNHVIQMSDAGNEQCSPARKEGGLPASKSKKAFLKIQTGYGSSIEMNDSTSQKSTDQQFVKIVAPQKDNSDRGPHYILLQEAKSGPGQLILGAGGDLVNISHDNYVVYTGSEKNPSNNITNVSNNTIIDTKNAYLNSADFHYFLSNQVILLGAGKDYSIPNSQEKGPGFMPVLCVNPAGSIVISDRVYASASPSAPSASLFQLLPFHG